MRDTYEAHCSWYSCRSRIGAPARQSPTFRLSQTSPRILRVPSSEGGKEVRCLELWIRTSRLGETPGRFDLPQLLFFLGATAQARPVGILQFLLMLRQTAESPDRHRVLHPRDRNTPVELGTFRDLVFEHNLTNQIEFGVSWDLPEPMDDPRSAGAPNDPAGPMSILKQASLQTPKALSSK